MILRFGLGKPLLELFDPNIVDWMGPKKRWSRIAAGFLVVIGKSLPKSDCGCRVVSRPGHVNQSDVVGLGFLLSAVRQFSTHSGDCAIGDSESLRIHSILLLNDRT